MDFLFINADKLIDNFSEILSNIKTASKNENIHIIAYSSEKNKEVFSGIFDKFLSFIIPSHFNARECVQAMRKYFEATGIRHSERRKHIRVPVQQEENVKISFKINHLEVLEGKITNLSLGGALFQTNNGKLMHQMKIGEKYGGLQINIGGKIARASAVIAQKKEFIGAIRFVDINENFIKTISKYIFKKLSQIAKAEISA